MIAWGSNYLGLFYQVYGISFLILGAVALLIPRQNSELTFAPHLWLLGCFGTLHGIHVFIDWRMLGSYADWLGNLEILLLLASYLPLLEFGRRAMRGISTDFALRALLIYPASVAGLLGFSLWASEPLSGLDAGTRYFVGGPGAMLTGIALYLTLRRLPDRYVINRFNTWLVIAAISFFTSDSVSSSSFSTLTAVLYSFLPTGVRISFLLRR